MAAADTVLSQVSDHVFVSRLSRQIRADSSSGILPGICLKGRIGLLSVKSGFQWAHPLLHPRARLQSRREGGFSPLRPAIPLHPRARLRPRRRPEPAHGWATPPDFLLRDCVPGRQSNAKMHRRTFLTAGPQASPQAGTIEVAPGHPELPDLLPVFGFDSAGIHKRIHRRFKVLGQFAPSFDNLGQFWVNFRAIWASVTPRHPLSSSSTSAPQY